MTEYQRRHLYTAGAHNRLADQSLPGTTGMEVGAPDGSTLSVDTPPPCSAARSNSTMERKSTSCLPTLRLLHL